MTKIKPYKEDAPINTITKIRSKLNQIGILVKEEYKENDGFHVCRVSIANEGLSNFDIGTNGKGVTIEYAFASAYAEFMERLQNNLLIMKTHYATNKFLQRNPQYQYFKSMLESNSCLLDYVFDPDEQILPAANVIENNVDFLKALYYTESIDDLKSLILEDFRFKELACVPFYNVSKNKNDLLPIELVMQTSGSNGMCAGNTMGEAIVQGLCEIFERYTSKLIYLNRLTPPTIPHEYFSDYNVYKLIKEIENKGVKIIIKDFSLGKGFPVIGIVVINTDNNTYNIKIGSDPWPITALERCLTELYQSFEGIRLMPRTEIGDFIGKEYEKVDRSVAEHINMRKIFINATGHWPNSIFGEKPSYEFGGLDFSHAKSNTDDVKYLVNLVKKLGKDVYIRDASYLGFNTYYVVVPGMSQGKAKFEDNFLFNDFYVESKLINNLKTISNDQLVVLVDVIESNLAGFLAHDLNFLEEFTINNLEDLNELDNNLFLCMANYRLQRFDKSAKYLNEFLSDKDSGEYIYYYACRDYISLKAQGYDDSSIRNMLNTLFDKSLAHEVINDLKDPDKIFNSYELPSCFDCDKCDIQKHCKYISLIKIVKNIQELQKRYKPNNYLTELFYEN